VSEQVETKQRAAAGTAALAMLTLFGLVVYLRLPETAHRPLDGHPLP
jgi:hypothetical protein